MMNYSSTQNNFSTSSKTSMSLGSVSFSLQKVNLVLTDLPFNTRKARGQSSSAHDPLSKRDREDALRLVSKLMAFMAHRHIFCSDLMLHH